MHRTRCHRPASLLLAPSANPFAVEQSPSKDMFTIDELLRTPLTPFFKQYFADMPHAQAALFQAPQAPGFQENRQVSDQAGKEHHSGVVSALNDSYNCSGDVVMDIDQILRLEHQLFPHMDSYMDTRNDQTSTYGPQSISDGPEGIPNLSFDCTNYPSYGIPPPPPPPPGQVYSHAPVNELNTTVKGPISSFVGTKVVSYDREASFPISQYEPAAPEPFVAVPQAQTTYPLYNLSLLINPEPEASLAPQENIDNRESRLKTQLNSVELNDFQKRYVFDPQIRTKPQLRQKNKHACEVCNITFSNTGRYAFHFYTHIKVSDRDGSRVFCPHETCVMSSIGFLTKYSAKRHLDSVHGKPRFECSLCHRVFARRDGITRHLESKLCHTGSIIILNNKRKSL